MGSKRDFRVVKGNRPDTDNQLSLFDIGNESALERIAQEKPIPAIKDKPKQVQYSNDLPCYGITQSSLQIFRQKVKLSDGSLVALKEDGIALEKALEGMMNFESLDGRFGVGYEILSRMNSSEILAMYIGIQQAKIDACISTTMEKYDKLLQLGQQNFPTMISKLVGTGYGFSGIKRVADTGNGYSLHPTERGDLIRRMQDVPQEVRNRFIESLKIPYRRFDRPSKGIFSPPSVLGKGYEDPIPDEKEPRHDYTAKGIWIRHISSFMADVHRINARYKS